MTQRWWYREGGFGGNANWDSQSSPPNYDNWWLNAEHTTPSTTLPGAGDKVYLDGAIAPATGPSSVAFATLESWNLDVDMATGTIWQNVSIQANGSLIWGRPDRQHNAQFYAFGSGADCKVGGDVNSVVGVSYVNTGALLLLRNEVKFWGDLIPANTKMLDKAWIVAGAVRTPVYAYGVNSIYAGMGTISFNISSGDPNLYLYGEEFQIVKTTSALNINVNIIIRMMSSRATFRFQGAIAFGSGDRPTIRPPDLEGGPVVGAF